MGPVSSVVTSVQALGSLPASGGADTGSSVAQNGARAEPAAAVETKRAVAQVAGSERSAAASSQLVPDRGYMVETARARALAAQRAYEMASLVAGYNPMNDPVP